MASRGLYRRTGAHCPSFRRHVRVRGTGGNDNAGRAGDETGWISRGCQATGRAPDCSKAGEAVDPGADGRVQEHQDRCNARQTLGAPRGGCGDGRPSDRDEDVNRQDRSL
jgi:hypothetical protein